MHFRADRTTRAQKEKSQIEFSVFCYTILLTKARALHSVWRPWPSVLCESASLRVTTEKKKLAELSYHYSSVYFISVASNTP